MRCFLASEKRNSRLGVPENVMCIPDMISFVLGAYMIELQAMSGRVIAKYLLRFTTKEHRNEQNHCSMRERLFCLSQVRGTSV